MPVLSVRTRWVVPALIISVIAAAGAGVTLSANAAPALPPKSPGQLLVDLQTAKVQGLSGTVVQTATLGLPALPVPTGGRGSSDLSSLVSGSHTMRIWYAGPQQVRLALLGTLGESDVIRNGRDGWLWNSDQNTATHYTLPAEQPATSELPGNLPKTPQEAADQALKLIGPSTNVAVDGTATVADRSAYELVLSPKDSRSLVGSIRLAVDAQTSVPLRVQVLPKGSSTPAVAVGFTQVSFATPDRREFQFSPPPGATVKQQHRGAGRPHTGRPHASPGSKSPGPKSPQPAGAAPRTVGTGWTTVFVLPMSLNLATSSSGPAGTSLGDTLANLPRVSGSWGSGRLLTGRVFSVLLTDDGRLAVGAVGPDLLYAALGAR